MCHLSPCLRPSQPQLTQADTNITSHGVHIWSFFSVSPLCHLGVNIHWPFCLISLSLTVQMLSCPFMLYLHFNLYACCLNWNILFGVHSFFLYLSIKGSFITEHALHVFFVNKLEYFVCTLNSFKAKSKAMSTIYRCIKLSEFSIFWPCYYL